MAEKVEEVDPCKILNTLCEKHSHLTKYLTNQSEQARKVLNETEDVTKYKHEIEYITKEILSNTANDKNSDIKEDDNNALKIVFHVTGFGKFGKIIDNPTTHLIQNLRKFIEQSEDIPKNVNIATLKVLHVSGQNSLKELKEIRESNNQNTDNNTIYIYLHFGVAASRKILCLESVAYNCCDFKGAPDELGWEPHNQPIIKDDNKNIYHEYYTTLPIDMLQSTLSKQYGYNVVKSTDPGRYVCNYIFYSSLNLSLDKKNEYNLFVHVPQFDAIDQETQCKFARDLIIEIAKLINWKHQ